MAKLAINGFGRIGRAAFKIALDTPGLEVVAINDLIPTDNLAYLLKYDTVYGRFGGTVEHDNEHLIIDGTKYRVYGKKDPSDLPWKDLDVDVVFECTGVFTNSKDLEKHIKAGAKYAILSAPAKDELPTIVHGVNDKEGEAPKTMSCASCTTNCITPVVDIVGRRIGMKKAMMTTIHAYTSSQSIVDGPHKKPRRGRAGAANLVPTSTGAAKATTKALPQYEGKFDGIAVRGPVPVGSVADITFITERDVTVDEINDIFRDEAKKSNGIVGASEDEIVSSDIIGDPRASIIDLTMTQVVDGDMLKVMAWYDNEWGYASQMVRKAVDLVG